MNNRIFKVGDTIKHFKYELNSEKDVHDLKYLYRIMCFAEDVDTHDTYVIYKALYSPYTIYARKYDDFISKVNTIKYPNIKQKYRFVKFFSEGD